MADAEDVWSPGGYVCGACGMPTESEPCAEHQPNAYAAIWVNDKYTSSIAEPEGDHA